VTPDPPTDPTSPSRRLVVRLLILAGLPATRLPAAAWARTRQGPFDHEHATWTELLQAYVQDGLVDYARLRRDGRGALRAYTDQLETHVGRVDGWTREQQMAFWINAYNAYTVQLVVDHYPVKGIRSIGGLLSGSVFRRRFIALGPSGGAISLDDIEHRMLRPVFREARIHFAVVCASISCPALRPEAYRADVLEAQLTDAARQFLGDTTKNRYDSRNNTLWLSAIFNWFREDFEQDAGSLDAFVRRYLPAADGAAMDARRPRIRFLAYDWSLNRR